MSTALNMPDNQMASSSSSPNTSDNNIPPASPLYKAPTPPLASQLAPSSSDPVEPTPTPPLTNLITPSPFRHLLPLLLGIGVFTILAYLGFTFFPKLFGKKTEPVILTYWGLWEPPSVMQTVIADYERDHPNVKINYSMQSPTNYRSRLQSSLLSTTSEKPDIFRIHNTWLPMLRKSLASKPASVSLDLSQYYPVVSSDFVRNGELYAIPLEIDGLALYYNVDMLEEVGATPPTDWNALRKLAFDLTRRNPITNIIERAGIAMGTAGNVDHWSDILGLLILQNSGNPGKPSETAVQDALTFYTIFSISDRSWDSTQPASTYAFATGSVAMMLAPAWRTTDIRAINPSLNFGIAPAPTLPTTNIAWATYWAEAVSASSTHPTEAWQFLSYLSTPEVLQKLYSTESQLRPLGEPYPLISQASLLATDPFAAPFVAQGPNYRSWYLSSVTKDEGINDEIGKYYQDALNAINTGSPIASTIKPLVEGVAQILSKYPEAQ